MELQVAAQATALALGDEPVELAALLERLATKYDVALTVTGHEGNTYFTAAEPFAFAEIAGRDHFVSEGNEHVVVAAPPGSGYDYVVASRRLESTAVEIFAVQRSALVFLLTLAIAMVALGLLFMRRSVLAPLSRMTALVDGADRDGLSRFGLEASDDLARLGAAIIGMTQRIDADRQRIAAQLDELKAAHGALRATQQQLVRAERLAVVGQLAAGLAHEIGNPLAVLSGYVEVFKDSALGAEETGEILGRMSRELDRIHAIMRDLLDFSRVSSVSGGNGDLGEAIEHVRKLLAPQESMRQVELVIALPDTLPPVPIQTDSLTQVLLNLILNAAEALAGRGRVEVMAVRDGDRVVLTVEDTGPGVPEDLRERIFDPFFTTKPAGAGTGLGLAVCERIITAAKGELSLERGHLGGARFVITLPVAETPAQ